MFVEGYLNQVGGHCGIFRCGGHVCKPFNTREYYFYQEVDERFAKFITKCCGCVKLKAEVCDSGCLLLSTNEEVICHARNSDEKRIVFRIDESNEVRCDDLSENIWAKQSQCNGAKLIINKEIERFLLLVNVLDDYVSPSVIDLKMGTRQYGDDASDQKRAAQTTKCKLSTSAETGIRLVGMQLFDPEKKKYSYINKYEGRALDREGLNNNLRHFFRKAGSLRRKSLLRQLPALRKTILEAQGFRFFSSSLLIAFGCRSCRERSDLIDLRMIDFAHSTFGGFLDDKLHHGPDMG